MSHTQAMDLRADPPGRVDRAGCDRSHTTGLHPTTGSQRDRLACSNHEVIEQPDIHQS